MEITYKYYVTYSLITKSGSNGFGAADVSLEKPIKTYADVLRVAEMIKNKQTFLDNVLVLSWVPLRRKIAIFK